MLIENSYNRKV